MHNSDILVHWVIAGHYTIDVSAASNYSKFTRTRGENTLLTFGLAIRQ